MLIALECDKKRPSKNVILRGSKLADISLMSEVFYAISRRIARDVNPKTTPTKRLDQYPSSFKLYLT